MLIKPEWFRYWTDNFLGYGSWKSGIWFISHEEPGGDLREEVAERMEYFYRTRNPADIRLEPTAPLDASFLCDIRELYRHVIYRDEGPRSSLYNDYFDYRFGDHAVLHGIWKNLIAFTHGYLSQPLPDLLSYQTTSFASPELQRESLIPLYPLPSPHDHAWYYSWLDMPDMPYLRSRMQYERHFFDGRIRTILHNLQIYKPTVVLMYEMNNINRLKDAVREFFGDVKFQLVKAIPRVIPQYHTADIAGTRLLITTQVPALKHNRKDTGFDWQELGRRVSSN